MRISIPSKTFLFGEYLVLDGGPSMILCTEPRFEMNIREAHNGVSRLKGINPKGPAGKFIKEHPETFNNLRIDFHDPHNLSGGFGASSAQFAAIYLLHNHLKSNENKINIDDFIRDYKYYAWDGKGYAPSGSDLIAQTNGDIAFYHQDKNTIKKYNWPFDDIKYLLIQTNNKTPTHQHLKKLKEFDSTKLEKISESAISSFENADSESFSNSINAYSSELNNQGFLKSTSIELLETIKKQDGVLAAKGCGALGADVILTLVKNSEYDKLTKWAAENDLRYIKSNKLSSHGLRIDDNPVSLYFGDGK